MKPKIDRKENSPVSGPEDEEQEAPLILTLQQDEEAELEMNERTEEKTQEQSEAQKEPLVSVPHQAQTELEKKDEEESWITNKIVPSEKKPEKPLLPFEPSEL